MKKLHLLALAFTPLFALAQNPTLLQKLSQLLVNVIMRNSLVEESIRQPNDGAPGSRVQVQPASIEFDALRQVSVPKNYDSAPTGEADCL